MSLMINKKKESVACYHWWSHPNEPFPYTNLRTPLLLSIATLRAVSDIPIIVYELSAKNYKWEHFPDKLNFKVCNIINPEYYLHKNSIEGWQFLSRIPDIYNNTPIFDTTMYVDSDVFWISNPEPFCCKTDKFCFDGYNSGYFYYNPKSSHEFHQIFDAYVKTAIYSKDFKATMKSYIGYDSWYGIWDEMVLAYMKIQNPELFDFIPMTEHATARNIECIEDKSKIKMFHCNGTMVENPIAKYPGESKHCRGIMCLVIKEFFDNICKVLDQKDLDLIFNKKEQDYYIPRQFSLINESNRLTATKDKSGHYHIQNCLS